ncbi:hypothetical protein CBA19CS11_29295 [Caballeronia novacaledonica]|nr:hypothetical protein CBA19CS11_29295 [Caballeronia novacaledonica]
MPTIFQTDRVAGRRSRRQLIVPAETSIFDSTRDESVMIGVASFAGYGIVLDALIHVSFLGLAASF